MSHPALTVWMHVRLSGSPVIPHHACEIMRSHVTCLQQSGLADECAELIIGCNQHDEANARSIAPPKAQFVIHDNEARSELPTLAALRAWLPGHQQDYALYLHLKCATRTDPLCQAWRGCMTRKLVLGWHQAVHDLNLGAEAVGCHWLTPERWPGLVRSPYFGGTFWWSRASFLSTLPTIPDRASCREDFYLAESWIGMGPRRPQVVDYHPDWPSHGGCSAS